MYNTGSKNDFYRTISYSKNRGKLEIIITIDYNCQKMDPVILKKLFETIFYYIHEAPRLKRLFIRWSYLDRNDRIHIDEVMQIGLQKKQNQLYNTLRDALQAWEHLQDTQGAPGFQPGTVQYSCDNDIEQDLTYIMSLLENCLDQVYDQKNIVANAGIKTMRLTEEVPTKLSIKYTMKPSECKSDSRLSRLYSKSRVPCQRARSSSGNGKKQINIRMDLQAAKSCTNFIKLTASTCGYRSE